jgi:4-amino-4-deoxy-L-arabinose transferase-like glycosyltransferase
MRDPKHLAGWSLLALAGLFFLPFLGGVHLFDWDEINFAEISREMLLSKDYLRPYINYVPFWEKPPLFIWMQALAMSVFGVGEYAARFPNAICGMLTLWVLYRVGTTLHHSRLGVLWALSYFGSVLPFLYCKSGIIDPWFNLFIFLGLYYLILFYWKKEAYALALPWNSWTYLLAGGLLLGLAILTKGPAAYLIVGLTLAVYWVQQRLRFYINVPQFVLYTLAAFLVTGLWFGIETLKNGPWFITEFTRYQYRLFSTPDAGHSGFPGYHFVVLLLGCFPASIFAIRAFFKLPEPEQAVQLDFRRWMKYLFWVVLILFTIVKSKIVHYSSLAYFPLTYLAALSVEYLIAERIKLNAWLRFGLWAVASVYLVLIFALSYLGQQPEKIQKLLDKDPFARANLDAQVHWTGWEFWPGLFLLLALLLFFRLLRRRGGATAYPILFLCTGCFVFFTLITFVKRVEGYSQRAAIEFYKSKIGEDCYVWTYGYKSYAQLFYTRKPPVQNPKSYDQDWLLRGSVDKTTYIVCKINRVEELSALGTLQEIGRKNGFVFFKRK